MIVEETGAGEVCTLVFIIYRYDETESSTCSKAACCGGYTRKTL